MASRGAIPARPKGRLFIVGGAPDPRDILDPFASLRRAPPPGFDLRDVGRGGDMSLRAFKRAFRASRDIALFDATPLEIAYDLEEAHVSAPGGVVVGPETRDVARILDLGAPILALGLGRTAPLSKAAMLRSPHAAVERRGASPPPRDGLVAIFGDDAALYAAMMWLRASGFAGRLRLVAATGASARRAEARLRRLDLTAEVIEARTRADLAAAAAGAALALDMRLGPAPGETDVMRAAEGASARVDGPLDALSAQIEAAVTAGGPRAPGPVASASEFASACLRIGRIALARRVAAAS